jgi:hypothetical protein
MIVSIWLRDKRHAPPHFSRCSNAADTKFTPLRNPKDPDPASRV